MIITFDFETRSAVDLVTAGPWRYFRHSYTDITCLGVKIDDGPGRIWLPPWVEDILGDTPLPFETIDTDKFRAGIGKIDRWIAHNLEFERAGWHEIMHKRYGFPDLPLAKCDCTAARASVHALPRKLERVCEVLKLDNAKDMDGHALMMKMCKPRRPRKAERAELFASDGGIVEIDPKTFYHPESEGFIYFWHEAPEQLIRNAEYCLRDLEAEFELHNTVLPMQPFERRLWLHDQVVNERGIPIDVELVDAVLDVLTRHQEIQLSRFREILNHPTATTKQHAVVKEYLYMNGVHTPTMQKADVKKLLDGDLPDEVREVLEIRRHLTKSSTDKFRAMHNRVDADGRVRSTILHHGASTGRPAGKSIQPLNMPRDCFKGEQIEAAKDAFLGGDIGHIQRDFGDPYTVASKCLRGALCAPPDREFKCADYSSIEAVGNAWAAGEEWKLRAFRDGRDIYKDAATDTFGTPYDRVTSEERQIGKVEELALGYGGGIGAFASMAKGYGVDLETLPALILPTADSSELDGDFGAVRLAEIYIAGQQRNETGENMSLEAAISCDVIKRRWRVKNAAITRSWKGYEEAAFKAVYNPGGIFSFRGFAYQTWRDTKGNNYLVCQLPSGRLLYYFSPRIANYESDYSDEPKSSITHMTVDSQTGQWRRRAVYGGLLCENLTQALCRDIHTEAMLRVEEHGYEVVFHVYDEIVAETDIGYGSLEEFERLLCVPPVWAPNMPISADGWVGQRFRKG